MSCWQDVEFCLLYPDRLSNLLSDRKNPVFWDTREYSVRKRDSISVRKGTEPKISELDPKRRCLLPGVESRNEKMEHLLQVIGILAFAAAGIFFVLQSKFREYWSWYYNYAAGYVMLFTVLLQYMVWQFVRRRFDEKKREVLMGKLEEINQKRIAEALENEKKSLAKVSRSDQLRIDLITNVSHDLKTPLTSMVGYIELIKRKN